MIYLITTFIRFIIALIVTVFLIIFFLIEILLRLIGTILFFGSRRSAESCWDGFPKAFEPLPELWNWVFDNND